MSTTIVQGELIRDPSHAATLAPRKQEEEERDTLLFVSGWVLLSVAGFACLFLFRYIWRMYREAKNRNGEEGLSSPRGLTEIVVETTEKNQSIPLVIHQRSNDNAMEGSLLPTTEPKAKQSVWRERPAPTNRIQAFFVRMTSLSPPAMSSLLLSDENDNSSTMEHLSDESPTVDIEAPVQLSMDGKVIRPISSPKAEKPNNRGQKKNIPKMDKPTSLDHRKKKSTKAYVDVRSIKLHKGQDKEDIPVEDPVDSEAERRERGRKNKIQKMDCLKIKPWKDWKFLFTNLTYTNSTDSEDVDSTQGASPEKQPVPDEERPAQEDKLSKRVILEKNIALEAIYNKNRHSERQKSDASRKSSGSSRKLRRSDTPRSEQRDSSPAISAPSARKEIYPKPSMSDLTSPEELLDRRILGSATEDVSEENPQGSSQSLPSSSTFPKSRAQMSPKGRRKKTGDGIISRSSPKQGSKTSEKSGSPKRASPNHKVKEVVPPSGSPVRKKSNSSKKSPKTKKKRKKAVEKSDDLTSLQIPTLLPPPLPPLPFFATSVAANEETPPIEENPHTQTVETTLVSDDTAKQTEMKSSEAPLVRRLPGRTFCTIAASDVGGPKDLMPEPTEDNTKPAAHQAESAGVKPEPIEDENNLEMHQREGTGTTAEPVAHASGVSEGILLDSETKQMSTLPCESKELESSQNPSIQSPCLSQIKSKIAEVNVPPLSPARSLAVENLVIGEKTQLNLPRRSGHSAPSTPTRTQKSVSKNALGGGSVHSAPVASPTRNILLPGEIQIYASSPKRTSSAWKGSPNTKKKVVKQSSVASKNKLGASSSVHSAPVSPKRHNLRPSELDAPSPKWSSSVSPRHKKKVIKKSSMKETHVDENDATVNKKKVEGSPKPKKKIHKHASPKKVAGTTTKAAIDKNPEWQGTVSPVSTKSVSKSASISSPSDPACSNSERKGPKANKATATEGVPSKTSEQDIHVTASSPPIPVVGTQRKGDLSTASTICESELPRSISVISSSTMSSLDMSHPYTKQRRQRKEEANAAARRKSKSANKTSVRAESLKERPVKKKKTVKKKGKMHVKSFKPDSPPLAILSSCLVEEMSEITAIWLDDSERSIIAVAATFDPIKSAIKRSKKVKKNLVQSAVDSKTEANVSSGPIKEKQGNTRHVIKRTGRKDKGKVTGSAENAVVDGVFTWLTKSRHYRPPVPFDAVSLTKADETGSCVSSISGNASL